MDQSLLAAPHDFSQRATSFIASWCQGIHRMPFSYSQPNMTLKSCPLLTMHRNHPHPKTGSFVPAHPSLCYSLQNNFATASRLRNTQHIHARTNTHHGVQPLATPLNVVAVKPRGRFQSLTRLPLTGQTSRPTTRPETHQNLIHTDKEHMRPFRRALAPRNSNTTDPSSSPPLGV